MIPGPRAGGLVHHPSTGGPPSARGLKRQVNGSDETSVSRCAARRAFGAWRWPLLILWGLVALCLPGGAVAQHGHHHGGGHHGRHRHRHHHRHKNPTYAPPKGKTFSGISETRVGNADLNRFTKQVGAHPAVEEDFFNWDTPLSTGALDRWRQTRTRGILSLSTAPGDGPEVITPEQIAEGRGDHYILRLNQSIAGSGQVVYIRLMPEMNGAWNPYGAVNADGSSRGRDHSTAQYRQAWRRFSVIVHGGSLKKVNGQLRRLKMPRLLRASSNRARIYKRDNVSKGLEKPKVAMIWNPQTISSPDVKGNSVKAYWPGAKYVDWVAADIYGKYATPGIKSALSSFYKHYRAFPFAITEYSPWDRDGNGQFVRWLFKWAKQHERTRMLVYYRSVYFGSPYDIEHFDRSRSALRKILDSRRYMQYAPGARKHRRRLH